MRRLFFRVCTANLADEDFVADLMTRFNYDKKDSSEIKMMLKTVSNAIMNRDYAEVILEEDHADVAYSLPPVLKAGGDDVEIITPLYKCVWDHYSSQLTFRGTYPVTLRDMQIDAQVFQNVPAKHLVDFRFVFVILT